MSQKIVWIMSAVIAAGGGSFVAKSATPSASSDQAKQDVVVSAFTQPSDRRQLSFETRGIVLEEAVKEGQTVKKGDALLKQDDRMDRAQWMALKLQGDSSLQVEYAQKDLAYKQSKQKRLLGMHDKGVATDQELEEAGLDVDRAATQIKLSVQDRQQKTYEAQAKEAQVNWMTLTSPIDGVVEKIANRAGEATNPEPDRPSIIVVQNDPLWVIMNLPNRQVDQIASGDQFFVRYNDQQPWKAAKVQFVSPTADAKSFKRLVRLEVPNPEGIAGGHEIAVKLPARLGVDAGNGVARGE